MSLTDIIIAGLAGVKPATLKQSPANTEPRPHDTPAIGMADDTVKRYYFFCRQVLDEMKGLASETDRIKEQLFGAGQQRYFGEFMIGLCDGSKLPQARRFAELHTEIHEKLLIARQVGDLFWAEAKRRNPKLHVWQRVTLHADWTFSGSDESDKMVFGLDDLLGGLGEEDGLGLTSILKHMFGGDKPPRERDFGRSDRAAA